MIALFPFNQGAAASRSGLVRPRNVNAYYIVYSERATCTVRLLRCSPRQPCSSFFDCTSLLSIMPSSSALLDHIFPDRTSLIVSVLILYRTCPAVPSLLQGKRTTNRRQGGTANACDAMPGTSTPADQFSGPLGKRRCLDGMDMNLIDGNSGDMR